MAYHGSYPEPLNDPDYDKNSDELTKTDVFGIGITCLTLLGLLLWIVIGV